MNTTQSAATITIETLAADHIKDLGAAAHRANIKTYAAANNLRAAVVNRMLDRAFLISMEANKDSNGIPVHTSLVTAAQMVAQIKSEQV